MKKRRHLSKEERTLWDSVAKTTTPIEKQPAGLTPQATAAPKSKRPAAPSIRPFEVGQAADISLPRAVLPAPKSQLNMDAKSFGRMKRGKLSPEARIDLHGMTVAEAHRELVEFILDASADEKRLVLVITGKGQVRDDFSPFPAMRGVLRNQVPQWLNLPPLKAKVLQVIPAHVRHGGEGAYYVYLKRVR